MKKSFVQTTKPITKNHNLIHILFYLRLFAKATRDLGVVHFKDRKFMYM